MEALILIFQTVYRHIEYNSGIVLIIISAKIKTFLCELVDSSVDKFCPINSKFVILSEYQAGNMSFLSVSGVYMGSLLLIPVAKPQVYINFLHYFVS